MNVENKNVYGVVAITGASSGLGAAIARQIAPQAKAIILLGRHKDRLMKTKADINAIFPKMIVHPIVSDLTEPSHRRRIIQDLSPLKVDTLILNAGSGVFKPFMNAKFMDHLKTVELNVTANLDLTYHLLPVMDPKARIQVISSHSSDLRIPNFAVYASAKTFLTLWAQTLAIELKHTPLKISIICAGAMETEFSKRAGIPKMLSALANPDEAAKKCIALLDRPGTHYLSFYDRLIAAANRFLPKFITDLMIAKVQGRYLK